MTTTVTIKACPGSDVLITVCDQFTQQDGVFVSHSETTTLPRGETREVYATSTRSITIEEIVEQPEERF